MVEKISIVLYLHVKTRQETSKPRAKTTAGKNKSAQASFKIMTRSFRAKICVMPSDWQKNM